MPAWPIISLLLFAADSPARPPSDALMERLQSGEVVVEDSHRQQAGGSARVHILMWAPVQSIWSVITSCDLAFVYVEGLETCETLEDSGEYAVIHQVVKKSWPAPRQDYTFEARREPYRRMEFSLLEGNLKAMEGSWRFMPSDGGTLVTHEMRVEPSIAVPRFLVRRTLRRDMPDTVACIRALAGGSGTAGQLERDLDRCGGPRPPDRLPAPPTVQ